MINFKKLVESYLKENKYEDLSFNKNKSVTHFMTAFGADSFIFYDKKVFLNKELLGSLKVERPASQMKQIKVSFFPEKKIEFKKVKGGIMFPGLHKKIDVIFNFERSPNFKLVFDINKY